MKMVLNDGVTPAPPNDEPHIKIASNGAFLTITNPTFDAVVRVKEVPDLLPVETTVKWKLPPIPAETFGQVLHFFRDVARKWHTEVAVLLHYGPEKGWIVTVPEQEVTAAHVDYQMTMRVPGCRLVGTIHSHVDMGAHHSGTDVGDEAEFDGLHITIGRVSCLPTAFDMDAEIVVRGTRFKAAHDLFTKGLVKNGDPSDDDEQSDFGEYGFTSYRRWNAEPSHGFASGALDAPHAPKEWWSGVKKKSFGERVVDFAGGRGRYKRYDYGRRHDRDTD